MAAFEFSIPYNNDIDTLNEVFRLKKLGSNSIREIYLSGPQEFSGSGRECPPIDMLAFKDIVDKIHNEGIRVNLVMNSTCEVGEWYSPDVIRAKMEYLRLVHKEYGVEAVTMANPIYIEEIRDRFPDIEICASVLADVDCVQRAVILKKAGADVITTDMNINRDIMVLKEIKKATNVEIKLMVNEGCLYKCPYRKFHFNYTSHNSKQMSIDSRVFFNRCLRIAASDPSQVLKSSWIRPEDISKYGEITGFFKIVGREMPGSKVIRCVKAYMQETWDGNLLDILCASLNNFNTNYGIYLDNKKLEENGFFEKVSSCDRDCNRCYYCEELAKKLISFNNYSQELKKDVTDIQKLRFKGTTK
jgi:collagenase-like PrtC family protease